VLQRYQEALDIVGNAANGRTVYEAACASCHAVRDGSVVFGPDLGTVSHWSPRALLDAVLAPSRSIADGYEQWRIVRRGGDVAAGILRTETAAAVTLAMPGGLEVTIPRQDVQAMQLLEGSAMPDGLEGQISTQEMADLFAFLMNPQ
jgi:putative heme-binding domain-containing protein